MQRLIDEVRVDLIGFDTDDIKERIFDKLEQAFQGQLRVVREPSHVSVHVKKANKEGNRQWHDMTLKLDCEFGLLSVRKDGWDILSVFDEALDTLRDIATKEKDKQRG